MSYRISVFAKKCGVNKETIRYYEQKALLNEPSRTNAGYRIYSDEDVKRVKFIKRLQDLGFSLSEIYKLLGVVDNDEVRCKNIFEFVSKKGIEIQEQIADLKRIDSMLKDLKSRCPDQKALHQCPIIESLIP
ncbi:Hg(II)-responsive transcriptional regulator [Caldifermentibacillus hisashii]|uniref:Hg(II)-responsive transcriptional regulator n=1 Tax=Caldifermentibacillus hisashii TaxID=996558 RepID=UPI001C10F042|nr:Hg(II)-responsive transcriptional regulator [Caldifermentibacillus hisashii]MBU5343835.1 Hg(II)-responsive transcriptional regulator [Caldifermentibacillus hisashii]